MGPLLRPGYILTFDMAWTPHLAAPAVGNANGAAVQWLLHVLALAVPSMIIQKIMLLGLLMLAGWGAHRLAALRFNTAVAYVAGTFAIFNPFVYGRFMTGQYLVLAGYALLPWVVAAVWRLLEQPSRRHTLAVAGSMIALSWLSIHAIGLALVATAAVTIGWGAGRWRRLVEPARRRAFVAAALIWIIANGFWLGPFLAGATEQAHYVAAFDLAQARAFQTAGAPGLPAPAAVAVLQGFWADPLGQYVLPSSTGWLFGLAELTLIGLMTAGLVSAWRRRDRLMLGLAAAGLLAWVLAVGIAWPPAAGLSAWLIDHLPYYRGYREPHKWAALLALAQATCLAGGLDVVRRRWPWPDTQPLELAARLVPLATVPMLLWGAGGQLRSVDYPASWYQLDRRLSAAQLGGPVLLLPWHQYLTLDFAGRLAANPAGQFFSFPTVTSANPEMPGVPDSSAVGSRSALVQDDVLANRLIDQAAGQRLARLGIRYVVLLKQADWTDYAWLGDQPGLNLETDNPDWQLWKVTAQP